MLRLASLAFLALCAPAFAQGATGFAFLNLTAGEITSLKLSPAGKEKWGQNHKSPAGAIVYNKRLAVTGVEAGVYDVKFSDKFRRECVLKNIKIQNNATVSIEERNLVGHCHMI